MFHWRRKTVAGTFDRRQCRRRRPIRQTKLGVETLESRTLLDATGILWSNGSSLTLSFAPDGTDIGGATSSLSSTLGSLTGDSSWSEAILRAFQTWAVHTNIDIAVVADGGQPFGSPGRTQGDPRFGDVRIGAVDLPLDVLAVSVSRDRILSGTWTGDVVMNSQAKLKTVDEVFAIAVHEAGHVLGLGHSDDPLSPMFRHGIPTSVVPTAEDIADLQARYGIPRADVYESAESSPPHIDDGPSPDPSPDQVMDDPEDRRPIDSEDDPPELENDPPELESDSPELEDDPPEREDSGGERRDGRGGGSRHDDGELEGNFDSPSPNSGESAATSGLDEGAVDLKLMSTRDADEGSAPSLIHGNLDRPGEVDSYDLQVPSHYGGPLTLSLRTAGISLLAPSLSVYGSDGALLGRVASSSTQGDLLTLSLDSVASYQRLVLAVESGGPDLFAVGGYSLVATFDDLNQVSAETIDDLSGRGYWPSNQADVQRYLEGADDRRWLNDDRHTDDRFDVQLPEETAPGFAPSTRFEMLGSIADTTDVDHYRIRSPNLPLDEAELVMTVYLTSLDNAALVPELAVFDKDRQPLNGHVLANGGGDYIVQFPNIAAGTDHTLRVAAADSLDLFNTGNYRVTVAFGQSEVTLGAFVSGVIEPTSPFPTQLLHVAQSSLFYFALDTTGAAADPNTVAVMDVRDQGQRSLFRLASSAGQIRTAGTVLLAPGTYFVQVFGLSPDGSPVARVPYTIRGTVVSDPIGIGSRDPTQQPVFRCQDGPDTFCYPGGLQSKNVFAWQSPADEPTVPPTVDRPQLTSLLRGDWWSWYWGLDQDNQVPVTEGEAYETDADRPLTVPPETGVLRNDIDPEGDPITAVLANDVQHGTLALHPNGAFTYRPDPHFAGTDRFTYVALDLAGQSAATQVTLAVQRTEAPPLGQIRDVDPTVRVASVSDVTIEFTGPVAGFDASDLVLTRDGGENLLGDQVTLVSSDGQHWTLSNLSNLTDRPGQYQLELLASVAGIQDLHGAAVSTDTRTQWTNIRQAGDADATGRFDQLDIIEVLQAGKYRTRAAATWAEGDWNGDGVFDQFDVTLALRSGGYSGPAGNP